MPTNQRKTRLTVEQHKKLAKCLYSIDDEIGKILDELVIGCGISVKEADKFATTGVGRRHLDNLKSKLDSLFLLDNPHLDVSATPYYGKKNHS